MTIHRLGQIWFLFGCATALPLLAAPAALASTVEVVRLDGAGTLVMAGGDLVTPEASVLPPGSSESGLVFAPENGSSLEVGPLFAEVDFYTSPLEAIVVNADAEDVVAFAGQPAGSSLATSGRPGGSGAAFPSSTDLATGTLDGTVGQGGTGTIEGTVPGTSVITIDGLLTDPSPVPIPGAAVLFATGLGALAAGQLRRRPMR